MMCEEVNINIPEINKMVFIFKNVQKHAELLTWKTQW